MCGDQDDSGIADDGTGRLGRWVSDQMKRLRRTYFDGDQPDTAPALSRNLAGLTLLIVIVVLATPLLPGADDQTDLPGYGWAALTALTMVFTALGFFIAGEQIGELIEAMGVRVVSEEPRSQKEIWRPPARLLFWCAMVMLLQLVVVVAVTGGPISSPFGPILLGGIVLAQVPVHNTFTIWLVAIGGSTVAIAAAVASETVFVTLAQPAQEDWTPWDPVPSTALVLLASTLVNRATHIPQARANR